MGSSTPTSPSEPPSIERPPALFNLELMSHEQIQMLGRVLAHADFSLDQIAGALPKGPEAARRGHEHLIVSGLTSDFEECLADHFRVGEAEDRFALFTRLASSDHADDAYYAASAANGLFVRGPDLVVRSLWGILARDERQWEGDEPGGARDRAWDALDELAPRLSQRQRRWLLAQAGPALPAGIEGRP
jgi:hypothetical protein